MINYEVAMRMVTLILWALGAVWSLFMVMENNKYFNIRKDEEKNTLACNQGNSVRVLNREDFNI